MNWRNFECQSIAPYEGGGGERAVGGRLGGIGVLEQRLVCLTRLNEARASDLFLRYQPPTGWLERYIREDAAGASERAPRGAALPSNPGTPPADRAPASQSLPSTGGSARIIAP